jgi:sugar lactone lactonase YvrE
MFDGFRVDTRRRIWTGAADGVHSYDPDGGLIGKVRVPEFVSNLTFGGEKKIGSSSPARSRSMASMSRRRANSLQSAGSSANQRAGRPQIGYILRMSESCRFIWCTRA